MSSTRNLNQKSDYLTKKKQSERLMQYMVNPHFAEQTHHSIRMFDIGSGPSKLNGSNLSHNYIDIESKLRGIRSVNLEGPSFNPTPQSKQFQTTKLFENTLRENVYLPNPMIHHTNERAGFHNM